MAVYKSTDTKSYKKAGATDLLEMENSATGHSIYVLKEIVDKLVFGFCTGKLTHLSGPSGSAKTSLIEAIGRNPKNFATACKALGFPEKPLKIYPIEMCCFETPAEVSARRALRNGETYDEPSALVEALIDAAKHKDEFYPVVWLREAGRAHSSAVQGGFLNYMTDDYITLRDGQVILGAGIAWIADSNYAAVDEDLYTVVPIDAAFKRRFSLNIRMDYLPLKQEVEALRAIAGQVPELKDVEPDLIERIVRLGQKIREMRAEGPLRSLAPPTPYVYKSFLEMSCRLSRLDLLEVAKATLMGNASNEDSKLVPSVFNDVFGLTPDDDDPDEFDRTLF